MAAPVTFRLLWNHIPSKKRQVDALMTILVSKAIDAVADEATTQMERSRGGRRYLVPGTKRHYTASRPGHAPAIATDTLHQSIQGTLVRPTYGIVYTNVEYAPHLEYGTIHMAARPFLRPAANKYVKQFNREAKAIMRAMAR